MKTIGVVLSAGLALAGVASADRPFLFCDPAKSSLCPGLSSIYEFEEASDFVRTSETGGVRFLEPDGANVGNSATKKTGSYSLAHTAVANSYVYVPRATGPSGQFTTSFWIYVTTLPSATTKRVQILSTRDALGNEGYPRVYMLNTAGVTKFRYEVKKSIDDAVVTVENGQTISVSTWYHVAFGQTPNWASTAPYQQSIWISVNANTKVAGNIAYQDISTFGDFIVGAWNATSPNEYGAYNIDQMASWGATFSPGDLTRLYNAGTGCAFPFVASGTTC